ncbi:outer membrane protein assembly factor BamB family protein [Micromonospora sp. IBHARD004]|uniref:outer membrane protein assembly factor BamB family protein n=1 Tax=Micromonospora sp. IBHARD004 TaxID=3457764 RepID=UPI004057F06C
MTVIDLGELRDDPAPAPSTRRPRPAARPYRTLAVLAVALLTLAGGVPAAGRPAAAVPARPGAAAFLVGDRLYLVEPPDLDRNEGRQLVAYRIPADGPPALLWRSSLPVGIGDNVGLLNRAGSVLLTGPVGGADDAYGTFTVDARTGRLGWQQPGVAVEAGDAVLIQTQGAEGQGTIRRVDVPSGRALWSLRTPPGGVDLRYGPAGADRVVLAPASGEVEVRDAVSGARLVTRDIRPGELPSWQRTAVIDDLLLVIRDNGATVTGYGLDRLDRRWTTRLSLVGDLSPCGALLCAYQQVGGMWVLDPATGAIRWHDEHWQAVLRETAGRFLVIAADPAGASRYAVVEAATGHLLADLGSWELANWADPDVPLIGTRWGRDGRLVVAELDPVAARARVIGALPGLLGDCRVGAGVLVCRRADGGFGLWRLP